MNGRERKDITGVALGGARGMGTDMSAALARG